MIRFDRTLKLNIDMPVVAKVIPVAEFFLGCQCTDQFDIVCAAAITPGSREVAIIIAARTGVVGLAKFKLPKVAIFPAENNLYHVM